MQGRGDDRPPGPPGVLLLAVLLVSGALLSSAVAAEHARPFRIGALTESWGPTPPIVGLRDGLLALGYREHEQFVLGVRFTQGELAALPAAARELVQYEVDLLFASEVPAAQAAQRATTRIPIVFAGGVAILWSSDSSRVLPNPGATSPVS